MEEEPLEPAPGEFVLRVGAAADDVLGRARSLGAVERLPGAPRLCLLRVKGKASAKEAWQSTVQLLDEGTPLFPVLYDRSGAPHYPSGEVTVRFEQVPSAAELRRFCNEHGLELLRRNEFVAQQVVCEPIAREFLPDLVARLAAQPGVRRAWANTLSRYRRAGESASE